MPLPKVGQRSVVHPHEALLGILSLLHGAKAGRSPVSTAYASHVLDACGLPPG
ncbi:hypothetical protein [Streptomyces acidicola]|uniref:hypothetical protein n=1 Tax=Streptomyces acidicola TaxID=2596892 RepID=UPI0037FC8181